MDLLKCLLIENDCYKSGKKLTPKGVMVHSTGANNPNLRRYVQPVRGQEGYEELMAKLGRNANGNDWNRPEVKKCVHAFIGLLADGTVAAVQTLPWDMRGWHCGGDANNTHISFEICEDSLDDPDYFAGTYSAAVELTAYLCRLYDLDPLADGVVIGHGEGYKRGIASKRGVDRDPWFGPFGKTMDDFRRAVKAAMDVPEDNVKGEEIMYNTIEEIEAREPWAAATIRKLVERGAIAGATGKVDETGFPVDLGLTYSELRILTIIDRMGVWDMKTL